jgi:hypothetical protein
MLVEMSPAFRRRENAKMWRLSTRGGRCDDTFAIVGNGFPQEATMATIRKGTKQVTRWFKSFREANRPPYRWYEHGTYVA